MSYETNGRTDKNGNRYEIRYFILQMLKVLEENIISVTLEALGDDEVGTDIWIEKEDGTRESQQCKGRYQSNDNWTMGSINKYNILEKWKIQLDRSSKNCVGLVSPLSFIYLEDLIFRAKNTTDNPSDFYESQIKCSAKDFQSFYSDYCNKMSLNCENQTDLYKSIDYLKRTFYHQIPDEELKNIVIEKMKYIFIDEDKVYSCLTDLIINGNILGQKIDIVFLRKYLKDKNIIFRNLSLDDRIYPRIDELNEEYSNFYIPIANKIIQRNEIFDCEQAIQSGKSLVIHGKAGCGKSGITQSIIEYFNNNQIVYAAIKLDKRIPSENAERWGQNLGLPTSLAYCIDSISKNRKAVIILDQLDALRWTQAHSREALSVCSELINQIINLNYNRDYKISIIIVCRTYDLENDNNIKLLLKDDKNKDLWKKIKIDQFTNEIVKSIVGPKYDTMSQKLQSILKIPSNLYIWEQLDKSKSYDDCLTTNKLIQEWWKQLQEKCINDNIDANSLIQTKEILVNILDLKGRISTQEKFLNTDQNILKYLSSNNFLIIENGIVSFAHQILLDYFLAEKMLLKYQKYYLLLNLVIAFEIDIFC